MSRFELQTLTEYTDEAILQELRRVADLHSAGPLTRGVYGRLSPRVSFDTVRRRFGSWEKALSAAGLANLTARAHMPYSMKMQRGNAMTTEELIAEMRRVHKIVGKRVLTAKEFDRISVTHSDALRDRMGGWHEALEIAGIEKSELGNRYTDLQCYENIVALWTHFGRQPHYAELKSPPSTVGPKAYVLRWGSWRRALAAFVEWANADPQGDSDTDPATQEIISSPVSSQERTLRPLPEDRHDIPLRLKWKVHLRDRFRCLACGRSPAVHLGVELHADHIVAWADGGKTILENLQTLCQDCNLGKGKSFGRVE
jgi:hypothetical protein